MHNDLDIAWQKSKRHRRRDSSLTLMWFGRMERFVRANILFFTQLWPWIREVEMFIPKFNYQQTDHNERRWNQTAFSFVVSRIVWAMISFIPRKHKKSCKTNWFDLFVCLFPFKLRMFYHISRYFLPLDETSCIGRSIWIWWNWIFNHI